MSGKRPKTSLASTMSFQDGTGKPDAADAGSARSASPGKAGPGASDPSTDPLTAPYRRSVEEMERMPTIEETMSVCPECKLLIKGAIYRDGDNVMMRKSCPEHGLTVEKYWEDYGMYMRMRGYGYTGRGVDNPNYLETGVNCPYECGLCMRHHSHTALANVVVTNRCHLSCWYCFFYAKEGEPIYEPTVDELEKQFLGLKAARPIPANALQITGGEPTLHPEIAEIVRRARGAGFDHIQMNTTGINLGFDKKLAKDIKEAGCSTLYMSCDGVSARANPKNHWELPMALDSARAAGLAVVLVPTVIRGVNDMELGALINFALNNIDVVRSVNFQPVSLVGRMPTRQRESQRITIPGAIRLIEEQTNGLIGREHWLPIPYTGGISRFIEALTGDYSYDLSVHFACGAGTYIFLDDDKRIVPITEFIDAEGIVEMLQGAVDEMQGKPALARKAIAAKALLSMSRYVDSQRQPKAFDAKRMLVDIFGKHTYESVAALQSKSIFLGMMHFQDENNYDIKRVERCDIHYAMPDGEVLPFCTFNVFPEIYRDKIQRQYAIPAKEWNASHPGWTYRTDKYMRDVKKLEADPRFIATYSGMQDFFAMPANNGRMVMKADGAAGTSG